MKTLKKVDLDHRTKKSNVRQFLELLMVVVVAFGMILTGCEGPTGDQGKQAQAGPTAPGWCGRS